MKSLLQFPTGILKHNRIVYFKKATKTVITKYLENNEILRFLCLQDILHVRLKGIVMA